MTSFTLFYSLWKKNRSQARRVLFKSSWLLIRPYLRWVWCQFLSLKFGMKFFFLTWGWRLLSLRVHFLGVDDLVLLSKTSHLMSSWVSSLTGLIMEEADQVFEANNPEKSVKSLSMTLDDVSTKSKHWLLCSSEVTRISDKMMRHLLSLSIYSPAS